MDKEISKMYLEDKLSSIKIAKKLGVSKQTILRRLKKMGITCRTKSIAGRKCSVNENYFSSIDNEKKAYWLGFIAADGCVYRKDNGWQSTLEIGLSKKDINHLKKFKEDIQSDHKISIARFNGVVLSIYSKKIIDDLILLGITQRKSLTLNPPVGLRLNLIRHFIRGYFDGDGYVGITTNNYKNKIYHSLSIEILGTNQLLNFIKKNCEFIKMNIDINKNIPRLRFNSSKIEMIDLIYQYLYTNATCFLERKKEKFKEYYEILGNK